MSIHLFIIKRSTVNGTDDFAGEVSANALELSSSSEMFLLPSLSGLSGGSRDGHSAGQPGEVEQQRVHFQAHARGRRRISKDGVDTQGRRTKEREPPPH